MMLEPTEVDNLDFGCCLCDGPIFDEISTITIQLNEVEQSWWCHLSCFKATLHPAYRMFRDEFA